ncbi:hypothetical protein KUH32_00110 [Thalassococcus sp. CAU 1522]|uniref:A-factor biosynthesis hotdog domain-containing protein n=1 Tax=Thalassococcus arenae TaxID=2851652 RepID=A0ABS6N3J5_9RHOB|nr:AfsA-related hotdog domain-containing protein [Thalassococcus arenae]MBV2358164.1 hypothetical protein [Thalassococcus arenae]
MSALDRRLDTRNTVLTYSPDDRPGAARLIVDRDHPFFFDHPLDHVPGLLLLEGAVQAAQDCAQEPCFVSAIRADLIRYAFFDDPILLDTRSEDRNGRRQCTVILTQKGKLCARIEVELTRQVCPVRARPIWDADPARALPPCPGEPLNKLRPENVLITTPALDDRQVEARLLPMSGTCLFADTTQTVHPLYLLEAFMQVQRYLNATQDGDRRMRDILTGVSIEQTVPLSDLSEGVFLRGARAFLPTGPGRMSRSAWIYAAQRPVAKCTIQTARVTARSKPSEGEKS